MAVIVPPLERITLNGEIFEVPPQGISDFLTRQDEINLAILKAIKNQELIMQFTLPKTWMQDPVKLQQRLLAGDYKPYELINGDNGISLTAARTDAEFVIEGDTLSWATDGELAGITVRFNNKANHAIPLHLFTNWKTQFYKIYLTHTAQSGKVLYLAVGRESSAETSAQSVLVEVKNKVAAILDSSTANINNGATYTGSAFSIEAYAEMVGSLFADQNLTLYIDQRLSPNTNWDIVDSLAYTANTQQGFFQKVEGHEARVRIANASGTNTTAMRMYIAARRL